MATTSRSRRRTVRGMQPPGRRGAGAARGPAEMGAAAAEAAGPARFQCPEDFCARRLAAFCPESLGAPGKRLLLISAPADFRPESLSGHRLALLGSPLLRASQPDGSQKVYSLQASREESAARLLIAAGRPERLTCARPFGASLRIQERHADPGATRALFPVAERPPPQVPEGLKQRFYPFGARLNGPLPSSEAARKRGKKRLLLPLKQGLWQPDGPEQLLGGSPEPAGGLLGGWAPLKEEGEAATEPAMLPGLGGQLLWQEAGPSGHSVVGSSSGEVEEPDRRRARKREKRKTGLETEELPDPSSRYREPEQEPWLQGGREPEGGGDDCTGEPDGCKAKKKKKKKTQEAVAEGLWGAAAIKEEPVDIPCQVSLPEENSRATGEDPAGVPSCRKKKKKKKSRERLAEGLWGVAAIKEELGDGPCPGNLLEEGLGSPREEPGWELTGYIKQSPGKGPGETWGTVALKEELGDIPSLESLAQESLGAAPEDPTGELPSCKKKKKKKSRERLPEGLWGVAAIKEELGDVPCLGSPREEPGWELTGYIKQSPEKGPGNTWGTVALKEELGDIPSLGSLAQENLGATPEDPARELLSCKKKKRKKSRERGVEGLWGVSALKEEPRDISCLGSLLEDGLGSARGGPAEELLACKKKKKGKLDKEPLQEQGTETQLVLAAPLWKEEEPLQTNGAAPSPRPKKKGRREGEGQAGLSAAGT